MFLGKQSDGRGRPRERDEIVTTFCESVTSRCKEANGRRPVLGTTSVGEAMAPASGVRKVTGAGVALSFLVLLLSACSDDDPHSTHRPTAQMLGSGAADPSRGLA